MTTFLRFFSSCRAITTENLMYVKEDLIIPQVSNYPLKNEKLNWMYLKNLTILINYWVSLLRYPKKSRSRLMTLTETLIISDITKTESNNCFIIHCFKESKDKHNFAPLHLEIMHCARNPQISHESARR